MWVKSLPVLRAATGSGFISWPRTDLNNSTVSPGASISDSVEVGAILAKGQITCVSTCVSRRSDTIWCCNSSRSRVASEATNATGPFSRRPTTASEDGDADARRCVNKFDSRSIRQSHGNRNGT